MIFVSYSHDDEVWRKRLETMASPLRRHATVEFWSDREIKPGQDWRKGIEEAMRKATIAVLLVSDNFLASDFITSVELPFFLNAAAENKVTIFWVLLSPCLWKKTGLRRIQAVVTDKLVPLDSMGQFAWKGVLCLLCERIDEHLKTKEKPSINSTLNGVALNHINKDLPLLSSPATRQIEVLVFSGDNNWHRQSPIKPGFSKTTVYIGDAKGKSGAEYRIIALTTGEPLKDRGKYASLPEYRTKSNEVTVKRR